MGLSSVPSRLLSPAVKQLPQGYFSSHTQRDSISRIASPSEDLANSTYLTPSVASASCASISDLWSGTSNGSVESYHLTPPITLPDYEKPPYKARSESAASLNMSHCREDEIKESKQARRAKRRRSNRKHRKHPASLSQSIKSGDHQSHSLQYFPGYKREIVMPTERGKLNDFIRVKEYPKGWVGARETKTDNSRSNSAQLMSGLAHAVTTRRWSSVGVNDSLLKAVIKTGSNYQNTVTNNLRRSKNRSASADSEVINAVRARLTVREVSIDPPQNPTAITLRRASGILAENVHFSAGASLGGAGPNVLEQDQGTQQRRISPAYLITAEDIDSITDIIQSRLALWRNEGGLVPKDHENCRPRATYRDALPSYCALNGSARTAEDIKPALEAPQASSKELKRPVLKRAGEDARKLSKAFARTSVPEVLWENSSSRECPSPYSNTSSLSQSASDAGSESGAEKLEEGHATVMSSKGMSSPAASAEEFPQRISSQEDTSPTSRVFKWVFKEPLAEEKQTLHNQPDGDLHEALTKWKLSKISPPTTWKSLEKYATPTGDKPDVLSFPPLFKRQSTMDWISPLPDISAPVGEAASQVNCLYDAGIDARTGAHKKSIASLPDLNTLSISAKRSRHSLDSSKSNMEERRKSSALLHLSPTPRTGHPFSTGSALGVSSGTRKNSSARSVRIKINTKSLTRHYHADSRSWIKPRKDSGWPAHKSPSPEELASRKTSAVTPTQGIPVRKEGAVNSRRTQKRSRFMEGLAPYLSGTDRLGIRSVLAGAKADTVVSEVVCQGRGCGASAFDAKTVSTALID